jgi:hypothetical protein
VATFRFVGRDINIHWNGYDIKGPAGTVFSIPDQLYEEFEGDLRGAEPSLEWIDTNEFLTLTNAVSVTGIDGIFPISSTTTSSGKNISIVSTSASDGYVLTANGSGGVAWEPLPGDATGITNIIGTSPISAAVSGTSATISIDQSAITAGNASSAQATVYLVRNNTASTILKGTLVSATGAEPSGRIDIAPFSVTGLQDSELRVMGIATENIGVGVNGIVMSFGTLTGLDTRGTAASALAVGDEDWDEGTILYAHPTVPGKLTEVRPQHDLAIAFTTVRHGSTGQIAIRIVPGNFHLEWLHDVSADNPSDGDIIQYKNSSSLWTKSSVAAAGIAASVHTHDYQASGTYVNAVIGTSPASVSTASGTSTVSIVAGSINSTHLSATSVGSSQLISGSVQSAAIASGAVNTSAINSGSAANGTILTANGSGGATFVAAQASDGVFTPLFLTGV